MAKKYKEIDFEKIAGPFAKRVTTEIFEQLSEYEYEHGSQFAEDVMVSFLASFVASSVYKVLSENANRYESPTTHDEEVILAMDRIKGKVQNAIAMGFQGSISTLTGADIEYYCTIQPAPEPVSKLVC